MLASIPFLILACLCVGGGRMLSRRARHGPPRRWPRRVLGWLLMLLGVIFMTLGVEMW